MLPSRLCKYQHRLLPHPRPQVNPSRCTQIDRFPQASTDSVTDAHSPGQHGFSSRTVCVEQFPRGGQHFSPNSGI